MSLGLSARQEQCVRLTAFRTDKEIALHLGISEATVKKHVHEACQRLGVNRRKAALAILDRNGPGSPNDPMTDSVHKAPPPTEPGQTLWPPRRDERDLAPKPAAGLAAQDEGAVAGYRKPPRSPLIRLAVIASIAIVICAMLVAVGQLVGELHQVVERFDRSDRTPSPGS